MSLKKWFINYISSKIEENQEVLSNQEVLLEEDSDIENIKNYISIINKYNNYLKNESSEKELNNLAMVLVETEKLLYKENKILVCVTDKKAIYYPDNDFCIQLKNSSFFLNTIIRQLYLKKSNFLFVDLLENQMYQSFMSISETPEDVFLLDFFNPKSNINILFGKNDDEIVSIFYNIYNTDFIRDLVYLILQAITFLENMKYFNKEKDYFKEIEKIINNYNNREFVETTKDLLNIPLDTILIKDMPLIKPFERKLISIREIVYFFKKENLLDLIELVKICPLPLEINKNENKNKIREIFLIQKKVYANFNEVLKKWNDKEEQNILNIFSNFAFGYLGDIFCNYRINPFYFLDKKNVIIRAIPLQFKKLSEINIKLLEYAVIFDGVIVNYGKKVFKQNSISFLESTDLCSSSVLIKESMININDEIDEVGFVSINRKENKHQSFENQYIYQFFEKAENNLKRYLLND